MPDPTVSVLLSVHKDRGHLQRTLDSVLTQSYRDLELIVVDDGAPPSVRQLLRRRRAADGRVQVVVNPRNLGLTRSLNRGLERAAGRYIARIDEGDLWLPGKLQAQVEFLDARSEYVLVGAQYRNYSEGDLEGRSGTRLPGTNTEIRRWLFRGLTPVIHPSIVFRRGLLSYNPDASTSQDFDLYLRLSLLGKLHNLADELLLSYTPSVDLISVDHEDLQFANHVRMHREFLDVLRGRADRRLFVERGTDFQRRGGPGPIRARYTRRALTALGRLPRRSMRRRVLRNLLIPDFLVYYVIARSSPYRLPGIFRAYLES
jgi:glycosyltransferase involved in cell wall biosynthesis